MRYMTMVCAAVTLLALAGVVRARTLPCTVARELASGECPCDGGWRGRAVYTKCVRQAADRLAEHGGMGTCRTQLNRCATRSVCGKPKAVTCITKLRCYIAATPADCLENRGMVSDAKSCCDLIPL